MNPFPALCSFRSATARACLHANTWGEQGVGGPGKAVTARLAYLDWLVPSADVLIRMGRQEVIMPSYVFNSPVLDGTLDGVTVHAPINEMVSLNAGWLRPSAALNKWGRNITRTAAWIWPS